MREMNKVLIVSIDAAIQPSTGNPFAGIESALKKLSDSGDVICIISHEKEKLDLAATYFPYAKFYYRSEIKDIVSSNPGMYFVVIGAHEYDTYLATNNKILLLNPLWKESPDIVLDKYGLPIKNVSGLFTVLDIIKNQSSWYYSLEIDEKTKVLSLTSANTYGNHSKEETELVDGFKQALKHGGKQYFKVLLYHFLSAIANNEEFREVQDWAVFPSSGIDLNQDMVEFKERARYLMRGRRTDPLFIRHTATTKSHTMSKSIRLSCNRHFDTIKLNDVYKGKLRGRTICVLDDYLTHGTSFETARNLLLSQGVKKMIFVSLGRFGKEYNIQNYKIGGDVCNPGYKYQLVDYGTATGNTEKNAIIEIEALHKILYS
jgi:hypothetical protein